MTEILLQQLEEKMMARLSELENSRQELDRLRQEVESNKRENHALKAEREKLEERVKGIIALLETVNVSDVSPAANMSIARPVLVQA